MQKIILASSSIPRQKLLKKLCLPFETASPNIDESPLFAESPNDMVIRLAKEKAQIIGKEYTDALIIGADQVGVLANKILGKPHTPENAIKQLQEINGRCVKFLIGICLFNTKTKNIQATLETYEVYFRKLSLAQIEAYVAKDNPLQCAGAFQAEALGIALVEKFSGEDFTALIGLPLIRLTTFLQNEGVAIL